MRYYEGLIEWESCGLTEIPTRLLKDYIEALKKELIERKVGTTIDAATEPNPEP